MKENGLLPLPAWYDARLVANPFFQPNATAMMKEAYAMAAANDVGLVKNDKFRVLRVHVDEQPDFTWALTAIDPETGVVTRYLHPLFKGMKGVEIPEWWNGGQNRFVWTDETFNPGNLVSVAGGRLSVAGAWNDIRRLVEWDMKNAHLITTHAASIDAHPFTARFDKHFYTARENNPYGLKVGEHPFNFMDEGQMFPMITQKSLWHPKFNPDGWWRPAGFRDRDFDEIWHYVGKLGAVYLWDMHCHRHTGGAIMDPIVTASLMHHTFLRGRLTAEPVWFVKGASWRTEFFGMHDPEYPIANDPAARSTANIVDLLDGLPERGIEAFDLVVYTGQAASHCLLKTVQQGAKQMKDAGRDDLIAKVVFLRDGASNIVGFDEIAKQGWVELAAQGLRIETTETLDLEAEARKAA